MYLEGDPNPSDFRRLQSASVIRRRLLGEHDTQFIECLEKIGNLLRQQGQYDAAQPILERALALRRQVMGERHPATAQALRNLGNLRLDQGRTAEALLLLREAAESFGELMGRESPIRASCLHEVARALEELGRLGEAEATCNEAEQIFEKTMPNARGVHLRSLATLANLQQKQGKYAEAARKYEEIQSALTTWPRKDPFRRECTTNYASLLGAPETSLEPRTTWSISWANNAVHHARSGFPSAGFSKIVRRRGTATGTPNSPVVSRRWRT